MSPYPPYRRYRLSIEIEAQTARDAHAIATYSEFGKFTVDLLQDTPQATLEEELPPNLQIGTYRYQFARDFHGSLNLRANTMEEAFNKGKKSQNNDYAVDTDVDRIRLVWSDDPDAAIED